jgi:hypothetical protein
MFLKCPYTGPSDSTYRVPHVNQRKSKAGSAAPFASTQSSSGSILSSKRHKTFMMGDLVDGSITSVQPRGVFQCPAPVAFSRSSWREVSNAE